VTLVGPADRIRTELARNPSAAGLPISLVDAPDVVRMDEAPLVALRRKPRASVKVAAGEVAAGRAQALFSAGHTGATFFAAHAAFGVLRGTARPALAVTFPTRTGSAILVDAGANLDCRPEHLLAFGVMGACYAEITLSCDRPRVGLLSVGEEAGKGNDLIREAHDRLAASPLFFIGNVEARDLFAGGADVIVCDGFTGNVALKVGEGLVDAIEAMLGEEAAAAPTAEAGALAMRETFGRLKRRIDYAERGGAPLLGLAGLAVIGHGRSSARAIRNGILTASRLAEADLVRRLREALEGQRAKGRRQRELKGRRPKGT
jgi:glycerol-3-phosphate acyltransferase PlsX